MSNSHDTPRTLPEALSDLYSKFDRTPEISIRSRRDLERMIEGLEAEIHDRAARVLALHP